jgi:hypothetical protein
MGVYMMTHRKGWMGGIMSLVAKGSAVFVTVNLSLILVLVGCTHSGYQEGLIAGEQLTKAKQQQELLDQKVTNLEQQLRQLRTAQSPQGVVSVRQRMETISVGSTYERLVQTVGQPTNSFPLENGKVLYAYYVSEDEIYLLMFTNGRYETGGVASREEWKRVFSKESDKTQTFRY